MVLKLSSNGSDVFPKVLKLSFVVSECKPVPGLSGASQLVKSSTRLL